MRDKTYDTGKGLKALRHLLKLKGRLRFKVDTVMRRGICSPVSS
ncbi:hypothetical protein [Paenibacillus antibioticophila]|nr:hypothetical protein [Paenibacillus antibioticophila]